MAHLVENVRAAIKGYPLNSVHGWIDSTVALHWISGGGTYKQFVANRVRKINAKNFIEWRHVESERNPADIGSRSWPINIVTESSKESDAEAKLTREVYAAAVETRDEFDESVHGSRDFFEIVGAVNWHELVGL